VLPLALPENAGARTLVWNRGLWAARLHRETASGAGSRALSGNRWTGEIHSIGKRGW